MRTTIAAAVVATEVVTEVASGDVTDSSRALMRPRVAEGRRTKFNIDRLLQFPRPLAPKRPTFTKHVRGKKYELLVIPSTFTVNGTTWKLDSPEMVMQARRAQVVMLQLRGGIQRDKMPPWPPTEDDKLYEKWERRKEVYKHASARIRAEQESMLWLHSEKDPFLAVVKQFLVRETKPSHALGVWRAFLNTFRMLNIDRPQRPDELDAARRLLEGDNFSQNTTHPEAMLYEHLRQILKRYETTYPQECAILQLAFVTGQRLPDMVQLSVHDLES
jgi:hypothetical protein